MKSQKTKKWTNKVSEPLRKIFSQIISGTHNSSSWDIDQPSTWTINQPVYLLESRIQWWKLPKFVKWRRKKKLFSLLNFLSQQQRAFELEFSKWEKGFEEWKKAYATHPDKASYKLYEQKFLDVRAKLMIKRLEIFKQSSFQHELETELSAASEMAESILQKFGESSSSSNDRYRPSNDRNFPDQRMNFHLDSGVDFRRSMMNSNSSNGFSSYQPASRYSNNFQQPSGHEYPGHGLQNRAMRHGNAPFDQRWVALYIPQFLLVHSASFLVVYRLPEEISRSVVIRTSSRRNATWKRSWEQSEWMEALRFG